MTLTKENAVRSKKIRQFARDKDCTIRLPGCQNQVTTSVWCHFNGGGMGRKKSDLAGAIGCHHCHMLADGAKTNMEKEFIELCHRRGNELSLNLLVQAGIVIVK